MADDEIFTIVAYIMILCVMIIITAHKIFGLVTWMPQNVMAWIGQLGQSLGESADTEKANSIIVGRGLRSGGQSAISGSKPGLKGLPGAGSGAGAGGDAAKKKLDSQLQMGSVNASNHKKE